MADAQKTLPTREEYIKTISQAGELVEHQELMLRKALIENSIRSINECISGRFSRLASLSNSLSYEELERAIKSETGSHPTFLHALAEKQKLETLLYQIDRKLSEILL